MRRCPLGHSELGCVCVIGVLSFCFSPLVGAADWTNSGGNAGRNGLTSELGPDAADILWSSGPPSIIAWQPVTEGNRVFMVRQVSFIPNGVPNDSPIKALELTTGATLWTKNLPWHNGEWTSWVAGVRDGKVYASRSGNGASSDSTLRCLNAVSGNQLWESDDLIDAGPYDGVVFASDGDPIVGSFSDIKRIDSVDGSTEWTATRLCSVSSSCGGAVFGDGVYIADAAVGGHVIKKFDIDTGAFQYASIVMPGFTLQNTPMVGSDGTIYLSRTQNNVNVDHFYAFQDTGSSIEFKWSVPAGWSTASEFAVGPDGSVYMMGPGNVIQRLDPRTGGVIDSSAAIAADFSTPRMAIDAAGRLAFSNGAFSNGRFYSFNADLTERWSVAVPNINIGAPALGQNGTLVVCGIGNDVRAFRTELMPKCPADIHPIPDGNGVVDVDDLLVAINAWGACPPGPPCTADVFPQPGGDGAVNVDDLLGIINAWGACP